MRRTILLATVAIAACRACSFTPNLSKRPGAGPLFKIYSAGKYGYMDRNGRVVIPPRFDKARDFFHGLAAVVVNGRTGYTDEQGRLAIPAIFDDARDFLEELAPVRVGRRWGYIDMFGRIVVEPQFQAAAEFHEGLARILVWNIISIRNDGPQKIRFTKDNAPLDAFSPPFEDPCGSSLGDDGKFGFIDKSGRIVISPRFKYAGEFHEGLAWACLQDCAGWQRQHYGYVDRSGNVAIPAQYASVRDFSEGMAQIRVRAGDDFWDGFIDKTGRVVIEPKYQFAGDFHEGLARVELEWKWGYIDRTGKLEIPLRFREAWDFSEGLAVAGSWNRPLTYIDRTGRWAVWGIFPGDRWSFSGGLAPVSDRVLFTLGGLAVRLWNSLLGREDHVFYIDKSGTIVGAYDRRPGGRS